MKRSELEHVLRAAGAIAEDDQIVVIGSQAILGEFPDAPAAVLVSMEADIYPLNRPDRADLVDGSIGEGSFFHETFGYYAQGVGPDTATLPDGWQARLTSVKNKNTGGVEGLCLEVHDLALSKYVAGRDKDFSFTRALARHGLIRQNTLLARLKKLPVDAARRKLIAARIARDFKR
ncbi:MAG TPA: DUF6036 family nucleotidyltransferase [Casimicrobiaceae bacterium]|nr:DUF6036 family nucleotidyltransferase [Casimicrobiaceae bacterium]